MTPSIDVTAYPDITDDKNRDAEYAHGFAALNGDVEWLRSIELARAAQHVFAPAPLAVISPDILKV